MRLRTIGPIRTLALGLSAEPMPPTAAHLLAIQQRYD